MFTFITYFSKIYCYMHFYNIKKHYLVNARKLASVRALIAKQDIRKRHEKVDQKNIHYLTNTKLLIALKCFQNN